MKEGSSFRLHVATPEAEDALHGMEGTRKLRLRLPRGGCVVLRYTPD